MEIQDEKFGKKGKDKITGFEGIIIGKIDYLFGCRQYGIAPQNFDKEKGKRADTEWFDEGRIEIVGEGISPKDVQVEKPGADFNFDNPKC